MSGGSSLVLGRVHGHPVNEGLEFEVRWGCVHDVLWGHREENT